VLTAQGRSQDVHGKKSIRLDCAAAGSATQSSETANASRFICLSLQSLPLGTH
jgi:hypothetical protein